MEIYGILVRLVLRAALKEYVSFIRMLASVTAELFSTIPLV